MDKKNIIKVVLIGDTGVGKTSIVFQLIDQSPKMYNPGSTIGASFCIKTLPFKEHKINLHLWDTAGQERFRSISRIYYKDSSACLCVFDVTSIDSFKSVERWIEDYKSHSGQLHIIYLMANKCDHLEKSWRVSKQEIDSLANKLNIDVFYISAVTGLNVNETFNQLVRDTITKDPSLLLQNKMLQNKNRVINLSQSNTNTDVSKCKC